MQQYALLRYAVVGQQFAVCRIWSGEESVVVVRCIGLHNEPLEGRVSVAAHRQAREGHVASTFRPCMLCTLQISPVFSYFMNMKCCILTRAHNVLI